MKLEIRRLDAYMMSSDEFFRTHYEPEVPVIIERCNVGEQITPAYLKSRYMKEENRDIGWYDAPLPAQDDSAIAIPPLVRDVFARSDVSCRSLPMRVWLQPGGHRTLLHYDGNSLSGFNLQIMGRKRWTLISPDAQLPCLPFNFVLMANENFEPDVDEYDTYRFETGPGDMLFLPRYWIHGVESLGEININVNWVWTPRKPNTNHRLGRREVELLRLRRLLPWLNRITGDNSQSYGGGGQIIIDEYVQGVNRWQALRRLLGELSSAPRLIGLVPSILRQVRSFDRNNFNVQ